MAASVLPPDSGPAPRTRMPTQTVRERRLGLVGLVRSRSSDSLLVATTTLACFQAAEAFAPIAGGLVRSCSNEALSLRTSILRVTASSAPPGTSPPSRVKRMLQKVSSPAVPGKRLFKRHKSPTTKGFMHHIRTKLSPVRKSGARFLEEEDVRKEVLENTVDSFVGSSLDASAYKHLEQSQTMANHVASPLRRVLKTLPTLDVPPGTKTQVSSMLHTAMHLGHAVLIPTIMLLCLSAYIFVTSQGEALP